MAITRIPTTEASDDQLRDFCEIQQLDTSAAKSRADLMALLGPVWEHDYIPVTQPDTPLVDADLSADDAAELRSQQTRQPSLSPGQIVGGFGEDDPLVRVRIANTETPGGKDPVPVGVNGRTVVIQRNMEVDVPYRYFHALENAIRQEVEQDVQTGDITVTDVPNYPLTVIRRPSDAEVAAWNDRVANELMPA